MEKILFMKKPEVVSFPYEANLLSMTANHNYFSPWFYNSFFQLSYPMVNSNNIKPPNEKKEVFSPHYHPCFIIIRIGKNEDALIKKVLIQRKEIARSEFINFVMKSIDNGKYVFFIADSYYISAYNDLYKKVHFNHENFIYGYSSEEKLFHFADFINGIYTYTTASFEEIENAYCSIYEELDYIGGILLFEQNNQPFEISIPSIISELEAYLFSNSLEINIEIEMKFGFETYPFVERYIHSLIKNQTSADLRPFQSIFQHKHYMLNRIDFFLQNNYLTDSSIFEDYKQIETNSLLIRNMMIKYNNSKKIDLLESSLSYLESLLENEKQILIVMISKLKGIKDDY